MSIFDVCTFVALTILITYGIVESKLGASARIFIDAWAEVEGGRVQAFGAGFIYCPYCVGFWVAITFGVIGALLSYDASVIVKVPAFFNLTLLAVRAHTGRELIGGNVYSQEAASREVVADILRESEPGHEPKG